MLQNDNMIKILYRNIALWVLSTNEAKRTIEQTKRKIMAKNARKTESIS